MTNEELRAAALEIWHRIKRGNTRLEKHEESVMNQAYYAGVLPKDPDYSVAQWVEDGMPRPL